MGWDRKGKGRRRKEQEVKEGTEKEKEERDKTRIGKKRKGRDTVLQLHELMYQKGKGVTGQDRTGQRWVRSRVRKDHARAVFVRQLSCASVLCVVVQQQWGTYSSSSPKIRSNLILFCSFSRTQQVLALTPPPHTHTPCAQQFFFSGENYLEIDFDVHQYTYLARRAITAYIQRLHHVVWETAFIVQASLTWPQLAPTSVAVQLWGKN
eukprot:1141535-Pelagomonas_calceolata.AAC.3